MLGARLASLRKEFKKTQQNMADYLGITRPAYTAYEIGSRQPDYATLQALADFFDVSTDYLLGRTDDRELTNQEKLNKALQLRDGENIYLYDMEGLTDDDIEMLKKQVELYREISERRKRERKKKE